MPPPLPRRSVSTYRFAHFVQTYQSSPKGCGVDLRIVLFEDCSAFTRVAACILALSPIRGTLIKGFSHFVTSMTAPIAPAGAIAGGLARTGKRRLCTAHTQNGHQGRRTVHRVVVKSLIVFPVPPQSPELGDRSIALYAADGDCWLTAAEGCARLSGKPKRFRLHRRAATC
jgi:hypothetical protein